LHGNDYYQRINEMKHVNKWIVALTVILPAFMESLDASVVNVALAHISGSLSTSLNEVTWVSTSYLVANAVIIPLTVWFGRLLGRKRYLMISIVMFTFSSFLCGMATSLGSMILFRILQGISGGALIALSLTILLEVFPPEEHGIATAIFGVGIVTAPALGPLVGGWIINNWSWPWIFYINIPVGVIGLIMTQFFIQDPPYLQRTTLKEQFDYWGIILVVVGIGCLQVMLSKGQDEDWFASNFITALTIISVVSLVAFVIVELKSPYPVLNLRVFKDTSFTSANIISFITMFVFYGIFILLPIFLQKLMNYDAFTAGMAIAPFGLMNLLVMPVSGLLAKKINPKAIVLSGIVCIAVGAWMASRFNLSVDFNTIIWPSIFMGAGLGMVLVSLVSMMYGSLPKEAIGDGSSIFNALRNIAGSMGIAFMTTLLARRAQFHQFRFVEQLTPFDPVYQAYMQHATAMVGAKTGVASSSAANGLIYQELVKQSSLFSFTDAFYVSAIMILCIIPFILLLKRPKHGNTTISFH
jgi:DHA2 family multidrug resistance protein